MLRSMCPSVQEEESPQVQSHCWTSCCGMQLLHGEGHFGEMRRWHQVQRCCWYWRWSLLDLCFVWLVSDKQTNKEACVYHQFYLFTVLYTNAPSFSQLQSSAHASIIISCVYTYLYVYSSINSNNKHHSTLQFFTVLQLPTLHNLHAL